MCLKHHGLSGFRPKHHTVHQESHTGRNRLVGKMPAVELKEIGSLSEAVRSTVCRIKWNGREWFSRPESIMRSQHPRDLEKQAFGFLPNKSAIVRSSISAAAVAEYRRAVTR